MKNISKFFLLSVAFALLNFSIFSQTTETLTITTYYPIPHGVYQGIKLSPSASALACNVNSEGLIYYDDAKNQLMICQQFGWVALPASWTLAGIAPNQYIYPNSNSWNAAIGTNIPVNKLDVEGAAVIGATYSGTNIAPSNGLLVEGNTGIGTTSPAQKLDVTGNVHATGDICTNTVCLSTMPTYYFGGLYSFNYSGSSCSSSCKTKNPYTNNCSCPASYASYQLTESGGLFRRRCTYICMK
jgi:hypothetical protein